MTINEMLFKKTDAQATIHAHNPLSVERHDGESWVRMSTHPGPIDSAILHAENAFGGRLRILDKTTSEVLWPNEDYVAEAAE